jgi:hypothetical protein
VNGDGYSDLAVKSNVGNVYVYVGGASGLGMTPIALADPALGSVDDFGESIACAGDVNGDGYADLVVGSGDAIGSVYVYSGGPSGFGATHTTLSNPDPTGHKDFGYQLASAGDVNDDGYSDLAVATVLSAGDGGTARMSSIYVYLGGSSGLGTLFATLNNPDPSNDGFGSSLGSGGDVNGDGHFDLAVGASDMSNSAGAVDVYPGGMSDLGSPVTIAGPASAGGTFGASIFGATD